MQPCQDCDQPSTTDEGPDDAPVYLCKTCYWKNYDLTDNRILYIINIIFNSPTQQLYAQRIAFPNITPDMILEKMRTAYPFFKVNQFLVSENMVEHEAMICDAFTKVIVDEKCK